MDKFFRRSLNKKGFTMVELIVVIAIIGVLAAMILPNLFASDVPTKGKGYAKAYYFAAQEFFSRQKVAEDSTAPGLDPSIPFFHFYTTVNSFGDPVESGVLQGSSTITGMLSSTAHQSTSDTDAFKELVADFASYMSKNLAECDYEGVYYVTVDKYYRVQVAYWSEATIPELIAVSPTLSYIDDNNVGGYWSCAFPAELSTASGVSDRQMFKYIY